MSESHHVYRMFGESGELLYVGVTSNLKQRMKAHQFSTKWYSEVFSISAQSFPYRSFAERAEDTAIYSEVPKYNVICQPYPVGGIVKSRLCELKNKER